MRLFSTILFLSLFFLVAHVNSQDLPLLGRVPKLGGDWSLRQQEATNKAYQSYSWATFTNSKTGDILSFAAHKIPNSARTVQGDPVRQAAADMRPDGVPV